MTRALTADEKTVLAHVVQDPDAWWAHAQANHRAPEEALAAKVARWRPEYDAAKARERGAYKTRLQRDPP